MKRKGTIISILSLVVVIICASCVSSSEQAENVLFENSISEDATPAVLARIMQADKKPISEIKFEKGTYHFYPDKGLEEYCHISNHCDVMVSTAFPIRNFENLTIDGQGSTFIFHGIMIPFLIDHSKNITVKNLSVDWHEPFHSEGLIIANDEVKKTFDMQISEKYPYEIRNGQIYFIKEYYEHNLGQTILYDPARKAITFNTEKYTNLTTSKKADVSRNLDRIHYKYEVDFRGPEYKNLGRENRLFVEELKPGVVRIHNHGKKMPQVGMILSTKGEQGFNRVAPAFRITHTYGFNANDVTVHHAGGMGLIAENSADLILDHFNVTPSHGRMVSTTADATHFVGCRGKVVLRNCTLTNQLDDASNIHGTYQKIVDVLDDYRIGVRMGHSQQKGFVIGIANDTLGLVRLSNSFYPYQHLTIKSTQYINGRYQIITLNEKLPAEVQAGDLIENLSAYPELLVENCHISGNRARGLLISTPKKTVIRNNFFSTEMEALLIPVESGHWYESGNGSNITITGNVFQDCNHSGLNRGIIRFETDDDNENIAFHKINIINNKFNQFDNLILEISNTDNLKFTNNTITNSGTFPMLYPENPAIKVKSSKNIVFKDNTYSGDAKIILESDESIPNLKFH
ncbi:right-handed parallel beta-helix repeat-containing protein [Ancylomarina sp. 16SWW S1-10-2]|uniref:alpha-1,3-galactosidase-related protein n=1 Tax=Ancylomarina sp. 16SWW S1-10-2 TaxID=2499681 RepID=UPI0012ADF068|nr:right-handed parallel beta-helix repeat-containing protein [Ancylomarina sp. 16SWW S1-10-2]MRT91988.1 right-handed parallel beta-helix repeat-containing protein [Ancylomarina sp. 16SWW S1-10-2]